VDIPYGFDLKQNIGYAQIGISYDAGEFACDSIRYWWNHYGSIQYPKATSILILCDGGGLTVHGTTCLSKFTGIGE
jgi:Rhodopirellula transposase DDE domain